jgi:hypothetical protein
MRTNAGCSLFAQSIPGVFFTRLKKLQVLKMAYNELEVLPEEIGMLLYAAPTHAVAPRVRPGTRELRLLQRSRRMLCMC